MSTRHWHKLYRACVQASPQDAFNLLADLPNYPSWLPGSTEYAGTTDVEPYPVRLGTRYHDGRPDEPGKDWWGTVTGYQPPGSLDFHHTINVPAARAVVNVNIHYSFEAVEDGTDICRWLLLDIAVPAVLAPARRLIIKRFDAENIRTMQAVSAYLGAQVQQ